MKGIPKTPVEFDYDLWTTEDGKCMVRIKATGEVTEVERTVMQVLRSEEKRFRRAMSLDQEADRDGISKPTILSLDVLPEDVTDSNWLADTVDYTEEISTKLLEQRLREPDSYPIWNLPGLHSEWDQLQGLCGSNGSQLSERPECNPTHSEKSEKYFWVMVVIC